LNGFAYVNNQPLDFIDPSGFTPCGPCGPDDWRSPDFPDRLLM
jgi:hypothetical protein